jgi:sodium transport system permease protein
MNWSNVRLIFQREVRDQLRDRRTLFMIAVLPVVLYPMLGMSMFQVAQFVREQATKVLVVGEWRTPDEPALFEENHFAGRWYDKPSNSRLLELDFLPEEKLAEGEADIEAQRAGWRQAIDQGRYDAVLVFPPDFAEQLAELRKTLDRERPKDREKIRRINIPKPEILYSSTSEKSQITEDRIEAVLGRWNAEMGRENLALGHLPENVAQPFVPKREDLAVEGHRDARLWSTVLPFLLLIWALTGAFYPAVDICAGEKERGTLETLLCSPAERIEIVWGKLLTVMLFSMTTAVLNLISMGMTGSFVLSQLPKFGPPPPLAPIWLLVALVPVSAMFSALCLALAAFARSSKEGQYYLMPLVLVTLPLVMLPMAPGVDLNLGNSLIPVTGIVLLLRAMLEGNYQQALIFGPPVIVVTLACCLLAIRWAVEQFNSEAVLFRESERFDLKLWLRQLMNDREDTPTVAGAFFCGVLILLIRFFMGFALPQPNSFGELARLTVVTQLVVVATPALLMAIMLTRSMRKTLLLRLPAGGSLASSLVSLVAAVLLAFCVFPAVGWFGVLVEQLYPLSPAVKESLDGMLKGTPDLLTLILVMAVAPAICEELAFRGFMLSGFRHMGHKWRAIVLSSLFFGVTHAIFQ